VLTPILRRRIVPRSKRTAESKLFDMAIQSNVNALRLGPPKLTYQQLAKRFNFGGDDHWDKDNIRDLLGGHGVREYRWGEILKLAEVFDVSVLDVVMPEDDSPLLAVLASRFRWPMDNMTTENRELMAIHARKRKYAKDAFRFHSSVVELTANFVADIDVADDSNRSDTEDLYLARRGATIAGLKQHAKDGTGPDPSSTPTVQRLAKAYVTGTPEAANSSVWAQVWTEAEKTLEKGGK
jgi:hypothetical protein